MRKFIIGIALFFIAILGVAYIASSYQLATSTPFGVGLGFFLMGFLFAILSLGGLYCIISDMMD